MKNCKKTSRWVFRLNLDKKILRKNCSQRALNDSNLKINQFFALLSTQLHAISSMIDSCKLIYTPPVRNIYDRDENFINEITVI